MAYGQLRGAVLLAAGWLVEQGSLDLAEDIFWLTFDEILNGLRAQPAPHFQNIVKERKSEHAGWTALNAPPILGLPNFRLPARPSLAAESTHGPAAAAEPEPHLIRGLGASAGKVRGRVRLALEPNKVPAVSPGDVLVAVNAGPLWSPIFSLLGALVLDGGSLAQHAASTAREYGVPAVIAAQDATRRLSDGVWVTVDGTRGIVEIEGP
jgi:pyruvate,water dikinase